VNADILIVDEALAVGDAIFQHRCFRKIREMQEAGKTILYVGHDTEAVRNLCTSALLLDGGRIIERGDPNFVVNKYYALIADRERTYNEGNLIEHGEVPGVGHETVFDFVRNLKDAKVVNAEAAPVQVQTVEIQSVPRNVIFAHPPSKITYTVTIEPGTSLAFSIGIMPYAWDKISQGVKFDIVIESDGMTENIFSRVLQPKRNIGDRGWHNFILPLEKFSGKMESLSFSTSGSGEDLSYCWSAWGWVKVVKSPGIITPNLVSSIKENNVNICLENSMPELSNSKVRIGNKKAEIVKVEILDMNYQSKFVFKSGDLGIFKIFLLINENIVDRISVSIIIRNKLIEVYGTNLLYKDIILENKEKGDIIEISFNLMLPLATGIYVIDVGSSIIHSPGDIEILDKRFDCDFFRIVNDKKMVGIVDLNAHVTIESSK